MGKKPSKYIWLFTLNLEDIVRQIWKTLYVSSETDIDVGDTKSVRHIMSIMQLS